MISKRLSVTQMAEGALQDIGDMAITQRRLGRCNACVCTYDGLKMTNDDEALKIVVLISGETAIAAFTRNQYGGTYLFSLTDKRLSATSKRHLHRFYREYDFVGKGCIGRGFLYWQDYWKDDQHMELTSYEFVTKPHLLERVQKTEKGGRDGYRPQDYDRRHTGCPPLSGNVGGMRLRTPRSASAERLCCTQRDH